MIYTKAPEECKPLTDAVPWLWEALLLGHVHDGGSTYVIKDDILNLLSYLLPPPSIGEGPD